MGNIRKIHIEGHPTLLELTFQKSQGHGSQGKTKKLFQTEGDEQTQINVIHGPEQDLFAVTETIDKEQKLKRI